MAELKTDASGSKDNFYDGDGTGANLWDVKLK